MRTCVLRGCSGCVFGLMGSRVWGCGVEVRVAVESFMFMSGEDFALL